MVRALREPGALSTLVSPRPSPATPDKFSPSSTCRQSSRMSSSTSAWVCTKTRCAPRHGRQLVGHVALAIFLLRRRDQQHVAVGQNRPQACQVVRRRPRGIRPARLGGIFFRRIRIGTIDQHQVGQRRQIALDEDPCAAIDAQHFRRKLGMTNKSGPGGGGAAGPACTTAVPTRAFTKRTLAGAGAA